MTGKNRKEGRGESDGGGEWASPHHYFRKRGGERRGEGPAVSAEAEIQYSKVAAEEEGEEQ